MHQIAFTVDSDLATLLLVSTVAGQLGFHPGQDRSWKGAAENLSLIEQNRLAGRAPGCDIELARHRQAAQVLRAQIDWNSGRLVECSLHFNQWRGIKGRRQGLHRDGAPNPGEI